MATTMIEKISILNSTLRTLIGVSVVGAIGVGGWYGYETLNKQELEAKRATAQLAEAQEELTTVKTELAASEATIRKQDGEIQSLNTTVAEQVEEIDRLDTAMRLLKVNHRVARLSVLDQKTDVDGGVLSLVEFQETTNDGQPIEQARQFQIKGDVVYIDSWVVKFDDKYVEKSDLHRSTSLVLFRRIFGERQEPRDGASLDPEGSRPAAYGRGGEMSDFERQIWSDFWTVANDEAKQAELGIRAAHGEAPSLKIQKGKVYRIDLRASGGIEIKPAGTIGTTPAA